MTLWVKTVPVLQATFGQPSDLPKKVHLPPSANCYLPIPWTPFDSCLSTAHSTHKSNLTIHPLLLLLANILKPCDFSLNTHHHHHHHHHHHQSLNHEGRSGTTDDFATSFQYTARTIEILQYILYPAYCYYSNIMNTMLLWFSVIHNNNNYTKNLATTQPSLFFSSQTHASKTDFI